MKTKHKLKKEDIMKLSVGSYVFSNREIGVIIERGKTFLHKHSYVRVAWLPRSGETYWSKYYEWDKKFVYSVSKKEKKRK